ncbi:FAD-binding oxidoreductase [uncultured Ruegeria sp.]|uniref:NAD(P)/FAD-dependent oxidoreductase n=1 Tax=uncultured Ruegeria sp. TaxID=259304 RepID=UPI00261411AA|nr:FAD-binding oxidoreductase [uncultured Ruegeria sp.]
MTDLSELEHTNSYYAATQRDKGIFPTFEGTVHTDICIIGGGLTGVATAVELGEYGQDVVLLEGRRIGWGASGRNGGQIIGGYGEALSIDPARTQAHFGAEAVDDLNRMSVECVDIIRDRVAKYNIQCDLRWGYLDVARNRREMRGIAKMFANYQGASYPHEIRLLDRGELRDYLGTGSYVGGMANTGYGHLHVLDLCKAEARIAESLGARIFEQSLVTSLTRGAKIRIHTGQGTVIADRVVLAGNGYLSQLAPEVAPELTRYVLPATSYVIATEPLGEDLARSVMQKNFATCDQRTALDYFRLSADNRMLFGGLCNYSARDPRSITGTMVKRMKSVFPQLSDVMIDYHWGGHMGIGLNRIPQLGLLDENIFYAQAYSGHGVAPTHMSGRILAEALVGDARRLELMAGVAHKPFPGGRMLRHALFATGMAYYKLKDELV